jgi:glucose-6-phosphate dehydrogenase assembly protein OpcA
MSISPEMIERELREVWKQMAHPASGEREQAVMRACVLNLIIYSPDPENETAVTQTVADVSRNHPSRIFLLTSALSTTSDLDASVNALCHFQPGGRKQVCCEQIIIRSTQKGAPLVPGIVRPLLIPDLPVILWWRSDLEVNHALFQNLLDASTRLVFDSSIGSKDIADLAAFIKREQQWTAFSDFSWAQLTPWRVLISGFFDLPDCRDSLNRIERVALEYSGDTIPPQVHLIIGWLGSRLKWERNRVTTEIARNQTQFQGLVSLKIYIGGTTPGFVRVDRSDNYLQLSSSFEDILRAGHSTRLPEFSEGQMLSGELEIMGHDRIYEEAIGYFAQ